MGERESQVFIKCSLRRTWICGACGSPTVCDEYGLCPPCAAEDARGAGSLEEAAALDAEWGLSSCATPARDEARSLPPWAAEHLVGGGSAARIAGVWKRYGGAR